MYNGIGLSTVRGSATSGYIQRNLGHVRPKRARERAQYGNNRGNQWDKERGSRHANPEILDHQRKRQIEVKLMELRVAMEDRGYKEEDIEIKVSELRSKLASERSQEGSVQPLATKGAGSHQQTAQKEVENERFRRAFGVHQDHKPGDSFNAEVQTQRREERRRKYEERQMERERREEQYQLEKAKCNKDSKNDDGRDQTDAVCDQEASSSTLVRTSSPTHERTSKSPESLNESKAVEKKMELGSAAVDQASSRQSRNRSRKKKPRRSRSSSADSSSSSSSSSSSGSSSDSSSSSSSSSSSGGSRQRYYRKKRRTRNRSASRRARSRGRDSSRRLKKASDRSEEVHIRQRSNSRSSQSRTRKGRSESRGREERGSNRGRSGRHKERSSPR